MSDGYLHMYEWLTLLDKEESDEVSNGRYDAVYAARQHHCFRS